MFGEGRLFGCKQGGGVLLGRLDCADILLGGFLLGLRGEDASAIERALRGGELVDQFFVATGFPGLALE